MMVVTIGDIHGRPYWKKIDPEKFDKIIFIGDYVDSYVYDNDQILENLMEIIELKKSYPEKVVLILGNHDLQYMWDYNTFGCSGYRPEAYHDLHDIFQDNRRLFQVAFQIGNHIWTHAGISKGWYKFNKEKIEYYWNKFQPDNHDAIDGLEEQPKLLLADVLNIILWTKDNRILHQVGDLRGGVYEYGGITWADRNETKNGYLPGYHQVVGHTPIDQITMFGDENGSIRYIDVLGRVENQEWQKEEYFKKYNEIMPDELPITMFYECEI